MDDWTCKICDRKIRWFWRFLRLWYYSYDYKGNVHRWCYNNKQKNKGEPSSPIFA